MNKAYYNELSNIPTLTHEEQLVLAFKAKAGDSKAKHQLIEGNLRLVIYHAKKYEKYLPINSALTLEDLISEGNIALIQAVEKYDPAHGTHLSYFAGVNIKRYVIDLLLYHSNTIKLSYRKQKKLIEISQQINKMVAKDGDLNENDLEKIYTSDEIQLYFNRPQVIHQPDWFEFISLEDDDENAAEMMEKLEMAIKTLKPREAKIIREYYGIGIEKRKQIDIAKELGISKGRLSAIHQQAMKNIRNYFKSIN